MPKKLAPNTKAEEARARKASVADDKKRAADKAKADAQWADDAPKGRAAKKKEEDEQKRVEAAAKRAEKKRLEELEAQEMAKISRKGITAAGGGGGGGGTPAGAGAGARRAGAGSSGGAKVTQAELALMKEREQKELADADSERRKRAARVAEEAEYARMLEVENTNRMAVAVDARNVGEALNQLSLASGEEASGSTPDKHPEKRMKAAYKAFEESELVRLKGEQPGLTRTQYREQVWKLWKKSPQNPMNQQ